jgi:hypothetical protein
MAITAMQVAMCAVRQVLLQRVKREIAVNGAKLQSRFLGRDEASVKMSTEKLQYREQRAYKLQGKA